MNGKQKTLSSQIARINVVMALLILLLGAFALFLNSELTEIMNYYNPTIDDLQAIYESVKDGNTNIDWSYLGLPQESYVEVINNDYLVLNSSKGAHPSGYQYSVRIFNELVNDATNDMMVYYPFEDDREMLVLFLPLRDLIIPYQATLLSMLIFVIGTLAIVTVISKFSAKQIIQPIEHLSSVVHRIREGAYGSTIELSADNDLDKLADDINELSLAIDSEIKLRENLESSRQQLILDISHDLKTPLTNIIGYSESLSTSQTLSEMDISFLSAIQRNGQRANQLLGDLFTYSKLNAVEYSLDLHPFDLRYVLEDFIASCIPDIEKANKKYDIDMDNAYEKENTSNYTVNLDIQSFRRTLHNLIDNFINHSGDNSTITIRLTNADNKAIIDIQDNGVGIPIKQKEQIFNPFYRSDTSRSSSRGGSGLGLSITQKIIELHGGIISLQPSKLGTHFQIELPTTKKANI